MALVRGGRLRQCRRGGTARRSGSGGGSPAPQSSRSARASGRISAATRSIRTSTRPIRTSRRLVVNSIVPRMVRPTATIDDRAKCTGSRRRDRSPHWCSVEAAWNPAPRFREDKLRGNDGSNASNVIPAQAGMMPSTTPWLRQLMSFPRKRESKHSVTTGACDCGSSPAAVGLASPEAGDYHARSLLRRSFHVRSGSYPVRPRRAPTCPRVRTLARIIFPFNASAPPIGKGIGDYSVENQFRSES